MTLADIDKPFHTFALRPAGYPYEPIEWCQFERWFKSGFEFHTVCGGHFGRRYHNGLTYVDGGRLGGKLLLDLVWVGVVPRDLQCDVRRIEVWIEGQVSGGKR